MNILQGTSFGNFMKKILTSHTLLILKKTTNRRSRLIDQILWSKFYL